MTVSPDLNGLRIGITIGLRAPDESLWINGIKQNALFLAKLLMASPHGYRVTLVNTTDVPLTDALPWPRAVYDTRAFADVKDALDVLIELGGQISEEQTAYLKARGTKIVSMRTTTTGQAMRGASARSCAATRRKIRCSSRHMTTCSPN